MAQQFSAALDNVFGLDINDERSEAIEEKYANKCCDGFVEFSTSHADTSHIRKKELYNRNRELAELEARLKAMEDKLKSKAATPVSSPGEPFMVKSIAAASSTQPRTGAGGMSDRRLPSRPANQRPAQARGSSESEEDTDEDEEEEEEEGEEEEEDTDTEESGPEEQRKR
ncbi:MAG: hypothetical protein LQ340_006383 [Diploschistes diacapsis]|nr:MAG: hypothetical protein LQ340_006383 [Diploschistes diacapsis]